VPWVLGAALALRRAAFEPAGGFDERFVMYFEETDLSRRLADAGWETHFVPAGPVMHVGGASTEQVSARMAVHFYESMSRYYRHHEPAVRRRATAAIIAGFRGIAYGRDALRARLADDPERRAGLAAARDAWARVMRDRAEEAVHG
jgi:GT2 family glycosyltransferase